MVRRNLHQRVEGKKLIERARRESKEEEDKIKRDYLTTVRGDRRKMDSMREKNEDYCIKLELQNGCPTLRNSLEIINNDTKRITCFKKIECYSTNGIFCDEYKSWRNI